MRSGNPRSPPLVIAPLPALTVPGSLYDRLAAVELPGSNVPVYERATVPWAPGNVAAGKTLTLDVTVAPAGSIHVGDFAQAGYSLILDPGLILEARTVGNDKVRAYLHNPTAGNISVPAGNLNILAGSATLTAGRSTDAWSTLHTVDTWFNAGDQVFAVIDSYTAGDFIQSTGMTWLDVERVA